MDASVVIITRNRKEELRRAVRSACCQAVQLEVLVIDDGSDDGTSEMVRSEFPTVRVERSKVSRGYIFQRNRAASLAHGKVIFSIDDDAEFSSSNVIERTLQDFSDRRIGAVAIPYLEPLRDNQIRQAAHDAAEIWVTDRFVGTAHALLRGLFLKLGGYREHLLHQGEEGDYCLRMLEAGYVTCLGSADPIYHYESSKRSFERMDFYGRRNDILFAWHNVPMPYLPIHLVATTLNGFAHVATRAKHPFRMLSGIMNGYRDCARRWSKRRPVRASVYRLHRRLKKRGPLPLRAMEADLPELAVQACGAEGARFFSQI